MVLEEVCCYGVTDFLASAFFTTSYVWAERDIIVVLMGVAPLKTRLDRLENGRSVLMGLLLFRLLFLAADSSTMTSSYLLAVIAVVVTIKSSSSSIFSAASSSGVSFTRLSFWFCSYWLLVS